MTLTDLHCDYRATHDALHGAYRTNCVAPCPLTDHLLLQQALAVVRISEQAMNEKGAADAHP